MSARQSMYSIVSRFGAESQPTASLYRNWSTAVEECVLGYVRTGNAKSIEPLENLHGVFFNSLFKHFLVECANAGRPVFGIAKVATSLA